MAVSTTWYPQRPRRYHGHRVSTNACTTEAKLVSQLVLLIDKCPRSLKEISSMAPAGANQYVQEAGGVLNWLRKYSELFAISGKPGEEVIALKVARESSSNSEPIPAPGKDESTDDLATVHTRWDKTPESDIESALLLQGLPYQATENDIKQFLGHFTNNLKGDQPIQVMTRKGRRPSGFVKIQLDSPESAKDACECLHKQLMLDRYIEVFPFDKKYKSIGTMFAVANAAADDVSSQEDQQARSAVVQECRDYMELSGCNELLLSMLGGVLSNASRSYLKRAGQTLKRLLGEHPEEFKFSGLRQQQSVRLVSMLMPSEIQSSDCKTSDAATCPDHSCTRPTKSKSGIIELHRHLMFSNVEARSALFEMPPSFKVDDMPVPQTPELPRLNFSQPLQTPSDWGTPWEAAQQSFDEVQWSPPTSSGVCIHGLPCYTTELDVLNFLKAYHVAQHVKDMPIPVVFLEESTDAAVKSAMVSLQSCEAIHAVQQALEGIQMDMHTISVSAISSRATYPERNFGMTCTSRATYPERNFGKTRTSSTPSLALQSADYSRDALVQFLNLRRPKLDIIHASLETERCNEF